MYGLKSIILIGPIAVGKSTLASHLSYKYDLDILTGDDLIYDYLKEQNIRKEYFRDVYSLQGHDSAFRAYEEVCTKFILQLLKKVQTEDKMVIFDFGGNQTLFRRDTNFQLVNDEMQKFDNSILLLPDYDENWSLYFLNRRGNTKSYETQNRFILNSDCNRRLAKKIIYTGEMDDYKVFDKVDAILHQSPEMDEILSGMAYQKTLKKQKTPR